MKNKIFLFSLLLIVFASCDDFLDVNENPNYPLDVDDYLILPAAQASITNVMSADYGLLGGFWSQHWAQNNTSSQYKSYETYSLSSNSNVINRSYRELFIGGLSDNEIILRKAKSEENWGLYLMTATIKAYTYQYLVDLYDNVPYSEAFNGEQALFNPKIDTGKDVYDSIYSLLNTALAKDFSNFSDVTYHDYDLLLEANLDNWQEFANSIKLRILLRQYDANKTFVEAELTSLLSDTEASFLNQDIALTNFANEDSRTNPLYESDQKQLNTSNNIRANATIISFLDENNDPRMEEMFAEIGGDIIGMVTGSYEVPSTEFDGPKVISKPILAWDMPANLMTVAETEFLLAEANLRLGNTADAKTHYENGVVSSVERIGAEIGILLVDDSDPLDIKPGVYAFPESGTFDDQLKAIIMQKWIDCAEGQRGIESFIEQVRTGYPEESAISDQIQVGYELPSAYIPGTLIYSKKGSTGGKFPQRLPYADAELNYNSNAKEFKELADQDVMLSNVWWKQ